VRLGGGPPPDRLLRRSRSFGWSMRLVLARVWIRAVASSGPSRRGHAPASEDDPAGAGPSRRTRPGTDGRPARSASQCSPVRVAVDGHAALAITPGRGRSVCARARSLATAGAGRVLTWTRVDHPRTALRTHAWPCSAPALTDRLDWAVIADALPVYRDHYGDAWDMPIDVGRPCPASSARRMGPAPAGSLERSRG